MPGKGDHGREAPGGIRADGKKRQKSVRKPKGFIHGVHQQRGGKAALGTRRRINAPLHLSRGKVQTEG